MTRWTVLTLAFLALSVAALPATAQTASVWHNQKMNDMRAHQRDQEFGDRASQHYQLALEHVSDMQRLLREDERSEREQKKLDKAYRKAIKHLGQVIELEPEWLDAHLMLGSVHYKMADYASAKTCYEAVLGLDPEHADAQAYLSSAEWYLNQPEQAQLGGGGR